jgi:anti-sigma regulatory factor (Ser/Thr protein kinase)
VTRRQATFRGLAIFAAVWQGLWLVGDAAVRGMVVASPGEPAAVLLIAAMVAWLALWPCLVGPLKSDRRLRIVQISSMVFVVGAGLLLVARDSAAGADGWLVGASVVNLGAGLAGLYLTRTSGVIAVLAIVTAEIVLLAVVYAGGGIPWPLEVDLVYPFYAMALGLACVASRHALMKSASRQDAGELLLRRQQQVRASNESTDASVTRAETRLHETVLNTLTAIARGGLADDAPTRHRLAERARESADVLGAIARGSDVATTLNGDLRVDLTSVLIDVEESGMAVRLDGILDAGKLEDQVDDAIFVVVVSAVRESLFNVLRHAQATSVAVVGDVRRTPEGSWWRIRIHDNGQGFDTKAQGFGLRNVVVEAITECGGATWQYATNALPTAGAAAIFASMAALLVATALRHRGSLMPWWAVVAVLVGVPIMTHVEVLVASAANPTGDWTSEAGSALLFVIVASGPLWAVPAAAVSWFVAQEMQWIELTQPGMFVIIVAALLGWQLRRAQARARSLVIETERERAALAVSRSRLSQVRSRYYGVDTPGLIEMLEDIAAERVDPGDVEVREACAREERLIRSVLSLHPDEIVVHRDLVTLATVARGADVDLTIAVVDDLHAVMPLSTIDDAAALLAMARPGSKARASITRDRRSCTFRLVVEVDEVQAQVLPPAAEILDAKAGIVAIEEVCAPAFVDGPDAQRSAHV